MSPKLAGSIRLPFTTAAEYPISDEWNDRAHGGIRDDAGNLYHQVPMLTYCAAWGWVARGAAPDDPKWTARAQYCRLKYAILPRQMHLYWRQTLLQQSPIRFLGKGTADFNTLRIAPPKHRT